MYELIFRRSNTLYMQYVVKSKYFWLQPPDDTFLESRVEIDRIKLNNLWNSGWTPKELLCQSNLNFGFRMLNKLIKRILTPTTRVAIKNYVFLRLSDYLLRRYYQFKSYTHIIICKMICDYVLFCDIRQQMISTDVYELVGLIKRRRTFILFNSISQ